MKTNKYRYLTTTICGESCPCPDSVVVLLFWIGEEAVSKYDKELFKQFRKKPDLQRKKVQEKANDTDLQTESKKINCVQHFMESNIRSEATERCSSRLNKMQR